MEETLNKLRRTETVSKPVIIELSQGKDRILFEALLK